MKNIIIKVTSLKLILSSLVFAGLISSHSFLEYKNVKNISKVKISDISLYDSSNNKIKEINFMKINYESFLKQMDYKNPVTENFYLNVIKNTRNSSQIIQISELYHHMATQWRYSSTHNTNTPKASEIISSGLIGDSENFAILIASCIQGMGGRSRIVISKNSNNKTSHIYTEVQIANDPVIADELINEMCIHLEKKSNLFVPDIIYYRTDSDGSVWLNLDWGSITPGAKYFNSTEEFIFFMSDNKYTYNKQ